MSTMLKKVKEDIERIRQQGTDFSTALRSGRNDSGVSQGSSHTSMLQKVKSDIALGKVTGGRISPQGGNGFLDSANAPLEMTGSGGARPSPTGAAAEDYDTELDKLSKGLENLWTRRRLLYKGDSSGYISPGAQREIAALDAEIEKAERRKAQLEGERTWFQKGAFEDGYQRGDVVKTVVGTRTDAAENVATGAIGIPEKIADFFTMLAAANTETAMRNTANDAVVFSALNGNSTEGILKEYEDMAKDVKQTAATMVAGDLYDEQAVAKTLISNPVKAITGVDAETDSVLGEKSDALVQSAGQLAAQYGLQMLGIPWFATSAATSFGSEAESALQQGATFEEAGVSAAISAGAEILTEKLFGGDLFVNKAGFDVLVDNLTKGIANKFAQKAVQLGLNAAGEGAEEWLSTRIGQFGQWLAYNHDEKELLELLYSEEALDEAAEAFLGGTVLGGGMSGIKALASGNKAQQPHSAAGNRDTSSVTTSVVPPSPQGEGFGGRISRLRFAPLEMTGGGRISPLATLGRNDSGGTGVPTVPQGEGFGAVQQSPSILENFEETLALGRGDPADPVAAAVEAFKESGTVTNRLAEAILIRSKAVAQLREQVGLELPDTAAGKRNAVKEAVAKLAQMQPEIAEREATVQQKNTQLNIDNTHAITYNNSIYGGEQNERTASTGADQSRVSGVYESGGANAQGRREPGRAAVDSGLILLSPSSRNLLSQRGVVDVEMHESSADNAAFSAALSNARVADTKNGWAVTPKSMEELDGEGIRTFMDNNASTGFAIAQDGDIEAVFANKAAGAPKGSTKITIPLAIANGGTKLDCYGEGLVRLYSQYGFIPVARTTFNPEFANEGWTPDNGMPDIYFMMHNGDSADTVVKNYGTYPFPTKAELDALPLMEYDEAYAYRDNLLQEKANTGAQTNDSQTESVGAAPAGFDPNTHLQYQYGTLPEGENPVRSDDLPVSTDGANRVSQTAVTVKGAKVTSDEFADLLTKDVTEKNGMTYIPITNDATVQKAMDHISNEGWEAAKAQWQADVHNGKAGADMSAVGALLLNNAAKAGDKTAWLDILHDYQLLGTNTAQGLQALRILKKLTPSDKLYMAKRSVKQMVKDMKLDTEVTIDPELEAEYNEALTDEQRDAVLKKIQKNVAQQLPTTFMEKFTALRYVNMLGNLRTQGRNIVGNLTMKWTRAIHNTVATGIEAVVNKVSGGKTGRTRSATVSKAQKEAAAKDFESLKDHILDGGKYSDDMTATGFARGVQEQKQIFKFKLLEGYRKVTNWAMEQGDLIFAKDAYARALAGYLKANGITETDYSKVDPAIMDDARLFAAKEAQEATFRDTNWLSGWVSKIGRRKDTPDAAKVLSEGIMPFRKTPANVLVRAEEYSPLGVINSVVMSVRAAQKGSDVTANQVINSWAKTLTGTGLFGVGMLLQSLGLLSAGPDEDKKKDGFEDLNGWQDYALTLPDGTNLTIDCFSPSAIPVLMGAQFMQLIGENGFQLKDMEAALTSMAAPMVEMSMLQGVNDTLENIQYADSSLGQLAINAAVSYLTQALTNTLAGQLERSFEDSRMQTYVDKDSELPAWLQRTIGKASAKTPGLDYNQIPYINAWGEEEESPSTGLNLAYNLLSPVYFDKGRDDTLTQELNRLDAAQSDVNVYPSTPDKSLTVNEQDYNLSAEEYVALAKLQGQTQKQIVQDLIASRDYKALSDEDKAKAIRYAYDYARDSARGEVVEEHPGVTTKWMKEIKGDMAEGIIRHIAADGKYTSLSVSDASYLVELVANLKPEQGRTDVRDIQKIEAIAGSRLTEAQQKAALKDTLDDNLYEKYLEVLGLKDVRGANLDTDDYADSYRAYLEAEGAGKKARTIKQFQQEFGLSYDVAKKLYEIYG